MPSYMSPLKFFLLVFALSTPFYVFGALTGFSLTPDLPVSVLMVVVPATAAAILLYREQGNAGVIALFKRSLDYKRIKTRIWYAPIILLKPSIVLLTYALLRVTGLPPPMPQFRILVSFGMFALFFIAALGEELGWSGYAIDRMQDRWKPISASILLGLIWAVWHFIPLIQVGRSPAWIAWWSLGTVATRVLMVWIYNNTVKSVFAVALYHAVDNLVTAGPFLIFTSYEAQRFIALLTAFVAAVVMILIPRLRSSITSA